MLFDQTIPFRSAQILKRAVTSPALAARDHVAVAVAIGQCFRRSAYTQAIRATVEMQSRFRNLCDCGSEGSGRNLRSAAHQDIEQGLAAHDSSSTTLKPVLALR